MTWLVQQYDTDVHVVPLHDRDLPESHVLSPDCWCQPVPDAETDGLFLHRVQKFLPAADRFGRKNHGLMLPVLFLISVAYAAI